MTDSSTFTILILEHWDIFWFLNRNSDLFNLNYLVLDTNQLSGLPESIGNLTNLECLYVENNLFRDLSILKTLSKLKDVWFLGIDLPWRYWTKFSEWKSEWLLDEYNAEIRRVLIEQIGYEKICNELDAITLDSWREYTLLKIDRVETI